MDGSKCPKCGCLVLKSAKFCPMCNQQLGSVFHRPIVTGTFKPLALVLGIFFAVFLAIGIWLHDPTFNASERRGMPHFTSKADQIEWIVDNTSEAQCESNTAKINAPFHETTGEEHSLGSVCYLKWVKIHQPLVWENMLNDARKQPPDFNQ